MVARALGHNFSKAKYSSLMHMAIGSKSNVKFVYVAGVMLFKTSS